MSVLVLLVLQYNIDSLGQFNINRYPITLRIKPPLRGDLSE